MKLLTIEEIEVHIALHECECVHRWIQGASEYLEKKPWNCLNRCGVEERWSTNKPPSIDNPRAETIDSLLQYAEEKGTDIAGIKIDPDDFKYEKQVRVQSFNDGELRWDLKNFKNKAEAWRIAIGNYICEDIGRR